MVLKVIVFFVMLGLLFVLFLLIEVNVDFYFDKFMEFGIRYVYMFFENKSVELSEQFYSFMRMIYKNDLCFFDFECIE